MVDLNLINFDELEDPPVIVAELQSQPWQSRHLVLQMAIETHYWTSLLNAFVHSHDGLKKLWEKCFLQQNANNKAPKDTI